MKLVIKGRNVEVNNRIQGYAEKRLEKLSKYLDDEVTRLELELGHERNPKVADSHIAEATIWTKGPTIRAREASHDVFASIDLVTDKLYRQVRKYREKRIKTSHGGGHSAGSYKGALSEPALAPTELETPRNGKERSMAQDGDSPIRIVKTKQFQMGPMTAEEAALQMELVGHDFFVFVDSQTGNTSVLYKRADGDLGLIEPALTESGDEAAQQEHATSA